MSDRGGIPLTVGISAANRIDHLELEAVVDAVPPIKGPAGRPRRRPHKLHADKGYDYPSCRKALRRRGVIARIARKGIESPKKLGRHRYVIERTLDGFPGSGGWHAATNAKPPTSSDSPSWPAR